MAAGDKKSADLLAGEVLDLSDLIAVTTPTDTPLLSILMGRQVEKATSTKVEWREETLDDSTVTPALEGADATAATKTVRTSSYNNCMIITKTAGITGTLAALNPKGVPSELDRSIMQRMQEAKINGEHYILQGARADESGSTPRQMNGYLNMVTNVVDVTNVGGSGVGQLSRESFISAFEKMWDKGASTEEALLIVPGSVKTILMNLFKEGNAGQYVEGGSQVLGMKVDRIVTDFGSCNIIMDRHMPDETALGLNLEYCNLSDLRPMFAQELGKTGDKTDVQIIWEFTAKLRNQYAGFKITGIKVAKPAA